MHVLLGQIFQQRLKARVVGHLLGIADFGLRGGQGRLPEVSGKGDIHEVATILSVSEDHEARAQNILV